MGEEVYFSQEYTRLDFEYCKKGVYYSGEITKEESDPDLWVVTCEGVYCESFNSLEKAKDFVKKKANEYE